jgi:hypothetical protein
LSSSSKSGRTQKKRRKKTRRSILVCKPSLLSASVIMHPFFYQCHKM